MADEIIDERDARITLLEKKLYEQAFQLGRIRGALDAFHQYAVTAKVTGLQRIYNERYKSLCNEIKKATD